MLCSLIALLDVFPLAGSLVPALVAFLADCLVHWLPCLPDCIVGW